MTMTPYMASSSTSKVTGRPSYSFDVFLSFRGEDTRHGFVGNLYHALTQKGIKTFMDDEELRRGDEISPALLRSIQESRMSIVVFSENYANSSWCLNELVKILERMETEGMVVLPVFRGVDPSTVRHQRDSYEVAMEKHERELKTDISRVQKWRSALEKVANLSGFHFKNGYEYTFMQSIVDTVSTTLKYPCLHVADHPVGLESRIQRINELLKLEDKVSVRIIGIYGVGGIGKSTIARAVYNLIAYQFEGTSFISDVRENTRKEGLHSLQQKFLWDILGNHRIALDDIHKGIPMIESRMSHKRVLLVLDDVNEPNQLCALAGKREWFGCGSRIIITTRNKDLLVSHGVDVDEMYEVPEMAFSEARGLFCLSAFRKYEPDDIRYLHFPIDAFMHIAHGLPLALTVMGSNLRGKSAEDWSYALERYKKVPHKDILSVLEISFHDLEDEEKDVFLDVACFFNGKELEEVESILKACDFHPKCAIGKLVDKSLVRIDNGKVSLHDLVEEMGKGVVSRKSPKKLGERSRLWFDEDVVRVLTENSGSEEVEAIMLGRTKQDVEWNGEAFKKMINLRLLIVRSNARFSIAPQCLPNNLRVLIWGEYPGSCFPPDFSPKKLSILRLPYSCFTWEIPFKKFESLTELDFSYCLHIKEIPDVSGLSKLQNMNLESCDNLAEVHDSVGYLDHLVSLNVAWCHNLVRLPLCIKSRAFKELHSSYSMELKRLPDFMTTMNEFLRLHVEGIRIEEIPSSIGNLTALEELEIRFCDELRHLPSNTFMMQNLWMLAFDYTPVGNMFLEYVLHNGSISPISHTSNVMVLKLTHCGLSDEHLSIIPKLCPRLRVLDLNGNVFRRIPDCFRELSCLIWLCFAGCYELVEFPDILPYLSNLEYLEAVECYKLSLESKISMLKWWGQRSHSIKERRYDSKIDLGKCRDWVEDKYDAHALVNGIVLPKVEIPDWDWRIKKKESFLSFWARRNFPMFQLGILFYNSGNSGHTCSLKLRIHVGGLFLCSRLYGWPNHLRVLEIDEMTEFYDETNYSNNGRIGKLLESKWDYGGAWNCVEIECDIMIVEELCIKFESDMEDIRLTYPSMVEDSSHTSALQLGIKERQIA